MKKITIVMFMAFCTAGMLMAEDAQDGLILSGEFRSGIFWYTMERDQDVDEFGDPIKYGSAFLHFSEPSTYGTGMDDLSGWGNREAGRLRLNFQYTHGNIGAKFRFETTNWTITPNNPGGLLYWGYSFIYGDFFNNNLKISAGKMGDSPWGAGGPDLWTELDTTIGFRFEFTPTFIPFISPGALNVGFVLNGFNSASEQVTEVIPTLGDILAESVIGVSYTHDFFHVRGAYRFDSFADGPISAQLVYRIEERILGNYLPGFQIWANGYYSGLNPLLRGNDNFPAPTREAQRENVNGNNWLYFQYDLPPELHFTRYNIGLITRLRLGLENSGKFTLFYARPDVFFKLFDNLLNVGTAFEYAADVGESKLDTEAPYLHWYIEPQIRLNLAHNSYLAMVYRYCSDYRSKARNRATGDWSLNTTQAQTHSVNFRVFFTF